MEERQPDLSGFDDNTKSIDSIEWFENLPDYPQPEWLVENLIPARGVTVIAGAPKSYKSFFSHSIISAVINGQYVAGKFKAKQGRVLLIDLENDGGLLKLRITGFGGVPEKSLAVVTSEKWFDVESEENHTDFFNWLEKNKPSLIVIDTFRRFFGDDENKSELINKFFMKTLQPMSADRAVILIHHAKKKTFGKRGLDLDDIRGSTDIAGLAAHILILQKTVSGISIITESRQTKEKQPFTISLNEQDGKFSFGYVGEAPDDLGDLPTAVSKLREIIQQYFKSGELVRTSQLQTHMQDAGYSARSTSEAITLLIDKILIRVRRGQYRVVYGNEQLTNFTQ